MANALTTQVLVDGPRNVVIKVDGYIDTADLTATDIADPAALSYLWEGGLQKATQLRIDRIIYTVDEGLAVTLWWDATADVRIVDLVKAGHQELHNFGGYTNNAGAGKTGKIQLTTEGWTTGKIYEFTILLELVKQ